MYPFRIPGWIDHELLSAQRLEDIPEVRLEGIRQRLTSVISTHPVVSVVIAAWNEEVNIVRCLDSLSKNRTDLTFEIIVIDNNSTDRTAWVLEKLGVTSYLQPVQGVGPSRALGQEKAKGKYILSADADCVYPSRWIEIMTRALMEDGVAFVYGRFSYISDKSYPRWQLFLYEKVRDVISEVRHIKRPYLNAYGISLGYIRELGLKEGYLDRNIRGFDGRLCFDMMKHGKVKVIRSSAARAWTGTRALSRDGSFAGAVVKRVMREFARMGDYFKSPAPHDTKTSENRDYSVPGSVDAIKKKFNLFRLFKKD